MLHPTKLAAAVLSAALLFVASGRPAGGQAAPGRPPGYDLLDRLVAAVVMAAAPGAGEIDIGPEIIRLAKDLRAAREAKKVDDLFAVRYSRLLSAVRQALLMDPEVLYWPMYRDSMADFIEERTGQAPDWKDLLFKVNDHGGAGVGLGTIADAVMNEVVSLHIHLDTADKRPDILKGYLERSMGAAGAKK